MSVPSLVGGYVIQHAQIQQSTLRESFRNSPGIIYGAGIREYDAIAQNSIEQNG